MTEPSFTLSRLHEWAHPCALCGVMIKERDSDIEVEKQFPEEAGGFIFRRVWPIRCHEQYLDQSEEV